MTLEITKNKFTTFKEYLKSEGYAFETRPHQFFLARGDGLVVNLYNSGKIVLAGKESVEKEKVVKFLEGLQANTVEKQIKEYAAIEVSGTRIGTDEAGKGDYFGPLVIAGVLATENQIKQFEDIGIRDSKQMNDNSIRSYAREIKMILEPGQYESIILLPEKYNALHQKMLNVNKILGWGHAATIENLLRFKEPCKIAVADQFGDQSYIENALGEKGQKIKLIQVHKAEREIAVAAASILARNDFVDAMDKMGLSYGLTFPKGATTVLNFAKSFVKKFGKEKLHEVAKVHFKTTLKI